MRLIKDTEFRNQMIPFMDKYGMITISITNLNIAIERTSERLIRCEDCKYYRHREREDGVVLYSYCKKLSVDSIEEWSEDYYPLSVSKDDYCSKGERKENDNGTTERHNSNL